jgi:hypothetical protein
MFNSKHYIPILKWKAAEQRALENLSPQKKGFVSPLIQIVMPPPKKPKRGERAKSPEEQLEESITSLKVKLPKIPEEILKYWGKTPAFIDLSLIHAPLRNEGFTKILMAGEKLGAFLIPVIGLNCDRDIQATVTSLTKENKNGLCLRLFRTDFADQIMLNERIEKFLNVHQLPEKDIDLLVDFQVTDEQCLKLVDLNQKIPNLLKWRTFTFACGSFPVDLSACELGINYISRSDWNNWLRQINSPKLQRKPSFADYTIQNPIYRESLQFFPPSASIRYTLKDKWLVMRGQKSKSIQYLANAQLLSQHSEFFGANFSYGDAYIEEKGKNLKGKTGNAMTWLAAGINHHLACTVDQIANLT